MTYKVVFHIDELNKWDLVLNNVDNLVKALDNVFAEIVVLANSEAVKGLTDKKHLKRIKTLIENEVIFKVCNNALKSNKVKEKDLYEHIKVVPAGVFELMRLQNKDDFAYIKP